MIQPSQEVIKTIIEIATETGQPAVIVNDAGTIKVGVLNFQPGPQDFFYWPVEIEKIATLGEMETEHAETDV
jgi:hypothetical protein